MFECLIKLVYFIIENLWQTLKKLFEIIWKKLQKLRTSSLDQNINQQQHQQQHHQQQHTTTALNQKISTNDNQIYSLIFLKKQLDGVTKSKLNREQILFLSLWLHKNINNPSTRSETLNYLSKKTNLTNLQVKNWIYNNLRYIKQMKQKEIADKERSCSCGICMS